jgi:WXG100 family type VII secretion target
MTIDLGALRARLSQMRDAASTLQTSANRINDALETVENEVKALPTDRYISVAADQFRAEYNRITPQLREAYLELMHFHEKLVVAADEIEAAARPTL